MRSGNGFAQWPAAENVKFLAPADLLYKIRVEEGRSGTKAGMEALTQANNSSRLI